MTADKVFEALSSAPRRRILAFLSRTDMTAGEIVARFDGIMSQPAISKHLSVLEASGLVWRQKRGQNVHYGLRQDALAAPLASLPVFAFHRELCLALEMLVPLAEIITVPRHFGA